MKPAARGRDAQVPVAQSAHEIKRLLRRPLVREPHRVRGDALLDALAHVRRRAKEAIRRHQALDALVRALEVVRVDEEPNPSLAIRKVREDRARQKLFPERLPEALDLPERLRVLRPALDVPDPLAAELKLEVRLTSPGRVLAALVGQDLPRRAVRGDAAAQRLHHELRALMVRQRVRDDEARVIVHEGGQVEPLVTPQKKREDVRLPKLVRLRSLESAHGMFALFGRRSRLQEPRLMKHSPHH